MESTQVRNWESPRKFVEVLVDLDDGLLRDVFGLGFVFEEGEQQKVDGALAGADQFVKEVLFAGKNAANALGFEFRIGDVSSAVSKARIRRDARLSQGQRVGLWPD